MGFQLMDDTFQTYSAKVDTTAKTIALTSGPEKIAATRAVLRSSLVSSLVTDTEIAAAVLD